MIKKRKIFFWLLVGLVGCLLCCVLILGGYILWGKPLVNNQMPTPTPMDTLSREATLSAYGYEMDQYFQQKDMQNWMTTADKAVALDPTNYRTYFYRAEVFKASAQDQIGLQQYMDILTRGLQDIDKAISLENSDGDLFLLRSKILSDMAAGYPYRADRNYFYQKALENARVAEKLGSPQKLHPERQVVMYLTYLGDCSSAMDQINRLSDSPPDEDSKTLTLDNVNELTFACQGEYQKAYDKFSAYLMTTNNSDGFSLAEAVYLYQLGKLDEALKIVDRGTSGQKERNGDFYFVRALVEYDQGMDKQALQDADLADRYSWSANSFTSYIEGLEDVRNGKKDLAVQKLQYAEATLDILFNSAIHRAHLELEKLDAKPLQITPAVHISATSIPSN